MIILSITFFTTIRVSYKLGISVHTYFNRKTNTQTNELHEGTLICALPPSMILCQTSKKFISLDTHIQNIIECAFDVLQQQQRQQQQWHNVVCLQ